MSYRMGVGGSWGTISGSLIHHQTTGGQASCTSPARVFTDFGDVVGGLTWQRRAGFLRRREDSVDNEPSLWCVLQGPVKAEPGHSNEAQASVWSHKYTHIWIQHYCPSRRLFFFFFPTFAAVWKDFTTHPESYSHYGNQGLSWLK